MAAVIDPSERNGLCQTSYIPSVKRRTYRAHTRNTIGEHMQYTRVHTRYSMKCMHTRRLTCTACSRVAIVAHLSYITIDSMSPMRDLLI